MFHLRCVRSGTGRDAIRRSSRSRVREVVEQPEPVLNFARRAEVLTYVFASGGAHLVGACRIVKEFEGPRGCTFDAVNEVAGFTLENLQSDAAAASADNRPTFPQALTDCEPEALPNRLLHHDIGRALERVD